MVPLTLYEVNAWGKSDLGFGTVRGEFRMLTRVELTRFDFVANVDCCVFKYWYVCIFIAVTDALA